MSDNRIRDMEMQAAAAKGAVSRARGMNISSADSLLADAVVKLADGLEVAAREIADLKMRLARR